jgi:hypothetical protein
LKEIANRTTALSFDNGKSNGRRWVSLNLKNGVPSVPADPVDDVPLTELDAQRGWNKVAQYLNLTSNYVEGRISPEEAVEQATRAVLYGLERPTADWQKHTEPVEEILDCLAQNKRQGGQVSQDDDSTESDCECGGYGCLRCLTQELPFDAA